MWFSEKAAGKLPRGSSIQGSGNITEHKPETQRHTASRDSHIHTAALLPAAQVSTPACDVGTAICCQVCPLPDRLTFLSPSRSVYQSVFKGIPQLVSTDFG